MLWKKRVRKAAEYIDIRDDVWRERVEKRNQMVTSGETAAYYLDENLEAKLLSLFAMPERAEMDVWVSE